MTQTPSGSRVSLGTTGSMQGLLFRKEALEFHSASSQIKLRLKIPPLKLIYSLAVFVIVTMGSLMCIAEYPAFRPLTADLLFSELPSGKTAQDGLLIFTPGQSMTPLKGIGVCGDISGHKASIFFVENPGPVPFSAVGTKRSVLQAHVRVDCSECQTRGRNSVRVAMPRISLASVLRAQLNRDNAETNALICR